MEATTRKSTQTDWQLLKALDVTPYRLRGEDTDNVFHWCLSGEPAPCLIFVETPCHHNMDALSLLHNLLRMLGYGAHDYAWAYRDAQEGVPTYAQADIFASIQPECTLIFGTNCTNWYEPNTNSIPLIHFSHTLEEMLASPSTKREVMQDVCRFMSLHATGSRRPS